MRIIDESNTLYEMANFGTNTTEATLKDDF